MVDQNKPEKPIAKIFCKRILLPSMKGLLVAFLFSILLISASIRLHAQPKYIEKSAKYEVSVFGKRIGHFTVNQKESENRIEINTLTEVEVRIVFTFKVKFVQRSIYRDGVLVSSRVQTYKNDQINSDMHLERNGGMYTVVEDGKTRTFEGKITYSGSLLYFNEPEEITSIYMERSGESADIESLTDNSYILSREKGSRTNKYYYEDGILTRAVLSHPLASIHLLLVI